MCLVNAGRSLTLLELFRSSEGLVQGGVSGTGLHGGRAADPETSQDLSSAPELGVPGCRRGK